MWSSVERAMRDQDMGVMCCRGEHAAKRMFMTKSVDSTQSFQIVDMDASTRLGV
jgi:hypothetical protein